MKKISRMLYSALVCVVLTITCIFNTSALETQDLSEGTYSIGASLSCYVNAMGGVEFGEPLLTSSLVTIDDGGNKTMTLNFTKSSVTIYNITCDTFIDIAPSSEDSKNGIKNGTLGYYDDNGNLQTDYVKHTLSDDTALNSRSEEVHYVSSISFPVESVKNTYELTLYINSNVMGVQFGTGGSSSYPATLTVDWDSLKTEGISSVQEEQFETLPQETNQAQVSTEVIVQEETDNNTIEKDGLNIHYANGEGENTKEASVQYTAYLNMPLLRIMVAISAAVIIAGIVLIFSSKYRRKQGNK